LKRPERIRILGKPFKVEFVAKDHDGLKDGPEDDDPGMGRQDTDQQEIYIRSGQPLESEQDTVLHEVIHSVEETLELGMTEDQVTKLAIGLLAVLKDNPSFVTYLRRKK
jgi:hypothetical protein